MSPKIRLLMEKAREDIAAARDIMNTERPWRAGSDAYYAMFHAAEALLLSLDLEMSSHAATQAAFGQHFAKTRRLDPKFHRYLLDAFEKRITVDYDVSVRLRTQEVEQLLLQAGEFVAAAQDYLSGADQPPAANG